MAANTRTQWRFFSPSHGLQLFSLRLSIYLPMDGQRVLSLFKDNFILWKLFDRMRKAKICSFLFVYPFVHFAHSVDTLLIRETAVSEEARLYFSPRSPQSSRILPSAAYLSPLTLSNHPSLFVLYPFSPSHDCEERQWDFYESWRKCTPEARFKKKKSTLGRKCCTK